MAGYHTPFAAHSGTPPEALARSPDERPRPPVAPHGGGRPPLPPGARGASARLSSLALDDSFDSLLPLSPSLDNFLAAAGGARLDSRAPSQLLPGSGRLFSLGGGRLSNMASMNSLDLNWLLGSGGAGAPQEGEGGVVGMQLEGASGDGPAPPPAAAALATSPPTGRLQPAAQQGQQRQAEQRPAPARQPSLAELLVGSPAASPQLPPPPPLLLRSTPVEAPPVPQQQPGPPRAAPHALSGAKRAAAADASGEAAQRAERRRQLQAFSEVAVAAAAGGTPVPVKEDPEAAPQPPITPVAAAGMGYAAHCDAAAAHAAQAVALQQQMYVQSLMMGCGTNGCGGGGTAEASQLPAELAAQQGASLAGAGHGAAAALPHSQLAEAALLQRAGFGAALPSPLGGFAPDLALLPPHGYAGGFVSPPPPPGAFMAGLQAQLQAVPAQRGTGSMSTQDKMAVWAQQNALMAAITSSPCPEMAAATFHTSWAAQMAAAGGNGRALPYAGTPYGLPQPCPSAYSQPPPPSMQVKISTTPALRVATVAPLRVAQTPSGDGAGSGGSEAAAGGGGAASAGC